jgi:hypothetical protein
MNINSVWVYQIACRRGSQIDSHEFNHSHSFWTGEGQSLIRYSLCRSIIGDNRANRLAFSKVSKGQREQSNGKQGGIGIIANSILAEHESKNDWDIQQE